MACCLMAPSHHLNQCWPIIKYIQCNKIHVVMNLNCALWKKKINQWITQFLLPDNRHVTLVAFAETAKQVPYHFYQFTVTHLNIGYQERNLLAPYLRMSCSDLNRVIGYQCIFSVPWVISMVFFLLTDPSPLPPASPSPSIELPKSPQDGSRPASQASIPSTPGSESLPDFGSLTPETAPKLDHLVKSRPKRFKTHAPSRATVRQDSKPDEVDSSVDSGISDFFDRKSVSRELVTPEPVQKENDINREKNEEDRDSRYVCVFAARMFLGPLLIEENSSTSIRIRGISDYIHIKQWDVITH